MKKASINIMTLGCSKNLVDSEVLMRQLDGKYSVSHESNDEADIVIINTCGFIHDAKEESIDAILQATEAKKDGQLKKVYVMGCLSERYREDLSKELTDVDGIFGVTDLPELVTALKVDYKKELIGERMLTTPSHFAYLKISEGCDRTCAFCAIPLIRGKHKSKSMEALVAEVEFLASKGVKELLLIAQELTYYGVDLYGKRRLAELLERITAVEGIEWVRLHYAYPAAFPTDVLKVMRENPKVCNYLDIPLQHINTALLKSMNRGLNAETTVSLIERIKKEVPNVVLRTTLIVGFPGETGEAFQELYDFVEKYRFDRMGVFTYSSEEGTAAYELEDDVPEEIKQQRADRLMMLQQQISLELNQEKVGKQEDVIIDRIEGETFVGRTASDSPEVDNEVIIDRAEKELVIGEIYKTEIMKADFFDLYGRVL